MSAEIKSFIESQLKEMGFQENKIRKALAATPCDSVDQVMEWLLTHDEDDVEPVSKPAAAPSAVPTVVADATASAAVAAEASASTSDNGAVAPDVVPVPTDPDVVPVAAEPVKAKTPEELAEEKRRLEERIRERRRQREEEERQAEIEREKSRRQTGNAIVQLREKVEMEERVRLAEERKREKKEDAMHKQRILEEIKRDRENQRRKALAAQDPVAAAAAEAAAEAAAAKPLAPAPQPKTVTDNCRLAIRLPDGSNLQHDFNSREPLAAVKLFVQLNRKDVDQEDPSVACFTFRLPPATVFTTDDLERPLVDLGLCPSSRLVVVRK